MTYASAKAALDSAQAKLNGWDKALNDPNKFRPVIKCEWDRAFDAREDARLKACKADPVQFQRDYPSCAWLAVYLGLLPAVSA